MTAEGQAKDQRIAELEARLQAQEEHVAGVMASQQERLARLEALLAGEFYAQK